MEKQKLANKYRVLMGILVVTLMGLMTVGVSYAYWKYGITDDKNNLATTGCFKIELTDQKDEINLTNAFPITNAEGAKLKPFSFTLKNTCTIFAHYYVNLEILDKTTLDSKWVATKVNNEAITTLDTYKDTTTSISSSKEAKTLVDGYLGAEDSIDYTISLWMNEDATIDDDVMNKVFKSKVVIVSEPGTYSPVLAGYNKLGDAILANEYQTTPEISKQKIATKQTVDISNTAPAIKWVEKTGMTTSVSSTKISDTAINSDEATSDLTLDDSKIVLFTTKTFNNDTAKYSLSNPVYVDPTTIDYSGTTKYYYCIEYMTYDKTSKKLQSERSWGNTIIYQVTGATKKMGKTTWNDTSYDSITYNLNAITLTETELELDKSDKGLYKVTDDYGDSYYYRGNIKNNNVKFANFYWQIIRINGDGSVRLMYNGTEKNATGINQSINNQGYQFNNKSGSPAYVGYMYGNPDGTTFEDVHANITSSPLKADIDTWYKENIVDKGYQDYISDTTGFCGDRTLYSGDGISTTDYSYFGAYGRYQNNKAELTCPEPSRDLYTTASSTIGNKSLTYPVGLITYDELVLAGMDNSHINKLSWVYSTQIYWTMSPSYYYLANTSPALWYLYSDGCLNPWSWTYNSLGVRPVINLKYDTIITGGIGTSSDPFIIE